MREVLIILGVIVVLLGLTAFKYRKRIMQIFGIAKMLKEARTAAAQVPKPRQNVGVKLAGCSACGIFVPETSLATVRGKEICAKCRA
jgi:hypothetical protein